MVDVWSFLIYRCVVFVGCCWSSFPGIFDVCYDGQKHKIKNRDSGLLTGLQTPGLLSLEGAKNCDKDIHPFAKIGGSRVPTKAEKQEYEQCQGNV